MENKANSPLNQGNDKTQGQTMRLHTIGTKYRINLKTFSRLNYTIGSHLPSKLKPGNKLIPLQTSTNNRDRNKTFKN